MSRPKATGSRRNRGFTPYTGSNQQIAVRMAGYTPASEMEMLERGNGVFWRIRKTDRGVLIKVYDDKRVAKNLGVEYTGNIIDCPIDVVADEKKFEQWLLELRDEALQDR